jgi:hypothetical protein
MDVQEKPLGKITVEVYQFALGDDFDHFETKLYLNFKQQVESLIAEGVLKAPPERQAEARECVEKFLSLVERPEWQPQVPSRCLPIAEDLPARSAERA